MDELGARPPHAAATRPAIDNGATPTLHIGSIEVQLQPPAAPPMPHREPAAPTRSNAPLARGFTTPLGLRQG
jgi:hypothetical protein